MNVLFLKPHNQYRKDDVANVPDALGKYLVRVGVASETEQPEKKSPAPAPKVEAPVPSAEKQEKVVEDVVEKVKRIPLTEKVKKDAGSLEPVVNTKPDKDEVVDHTIETSAK